MGCWSNPGPSSSGPLPRAGVTERWPFESPGEQPLQSSNPCAMRSRTLEHGAGRDHCLGERRVRVGETLFRPDPSALSAGPSHRVSGIGQKGEGSQVVGVDVSTSAAPSAAKAMALGHGERCHIARSSPVAARWRIKWSLLRETAVPRPQIVLPQQSSTAGESSHAPILFIRFRHLPCESNAS